jgi:N-acetylglucosamine kinase-like BadF-type ATPase
MTLIADSGSTKTLWCAVEGDSINIVQTTGHNATYSSLAVNLADIETVCSGKLVERLFYYGAGVSSANGKELASTLQTHFPTASVFMASDLMGAARALLGCNHGFAAVLGTGSNSCLYDGNIITQHIPPLGFLLGDEGSGASIGKKLIADYVRGYMPDDINNCFYDRYKLKPDELTAAVYNSTSPNSYCASFTHFISKDIINCEYIIEQVIRNSFRLFFNAVVSHYTDFQKYEFNCVGSIAATFSAHLTAVAEEYGMKTGVIVNDPIDGLVRYHKKFDNK